MKPMSVRVIIAVTASYYDTSVDRLLSRDTIQPLSQRRQVAMYLCREWTNASFPTIGHAFSRDHSTVMHGWNRIRRLRTADHRLRRDLDRLNALLLAAPHMDEMGLSDLNESVTA